MNTTGMYRSNVKNKLVPGLTQWLQLGLNAGREIDVWKHLCICWLYGEESLEYWFVSRRQYDLGLHSFGGRMSCTQWIENDLKGNSLGRTEVVLSSCLKGVLRTRNLAKDVPYPSKDAAWMNDIRRFHGCFCILRSWHFLFPSCHCCNLYEDLHHTYLSSRQICLFILDSFHFWNAVRLFA
jgi:hypothetical protein